MSIVVVTGASSGIGHAIALGLSKSGHKVYGISRSKVHDKDIRSIQADVTDLDGIRQAFTDIFEIEGKIDVLINNAGMGISGSLEGTTTEDAMKILDVNIMGVFNTIKVVLPLMRASNGGKIINISSVASRLAIPFQAFYSASKAAVNAMSDALRIEVSPFGIQVCSVMPGDIRTGFTKNRRKNEDDHESYGERVRKSVAVMEHDEENGMDPEKAASVVKRLIKRKRMPYYKTIGFKYKLFVFLDKMLPARLVGFVVGILYGFKKG